jgi:hypothetical protein
VRDRRSPSDCGYAPCGQPDDQMITARRTARRTMRTARHSQAKTRHARAGNERANSPGQLRPDAARRLLATPACQARTPSFAMTFGRYKPFTHAPQIPLDTLSIHDVHPDVAVPLMEQSTRQRLPERHRGRGTTLSV